MARGAQLDAIRERGLTLWIGDERYDARIRATDRPETLGVQDVVFVALKSSILPEAAPAIAPLIGPDTSVVFAMNGIPWWYLYRCSGQRPAASRSVAARSRRRLARAIGLERVIGCMINSANMVVEPGVIRNSPGTANRFTLGEPDGTDLAPGPGDLGGVRTRRDPAPISTTIRNEIWEKLLRNLSTSPICAMTGEPIGVDRPPPRAVRARQGADGEGLATARATGSTPASRSSAPMPARRPRRTNPRCCRISKPAGRPRSTAC